MALNVTSVFRVGLDPTNNIVNALLNDGWRFLETAANTPAPTNPLPNALETINYVFDGTWNANQMAGVDAAFAAWANVANIFPQTSAAAAAEIVLHLTLGANILNFGGYSGTAGEATQTTTAGPAGSTFDVAELGRVHTYLATDGFQRGIPGNAELIFDSMGNVSPGGLQLIIHEIGHALGLKHPHDDGADNNPDLADTNIFLPGVPEDQPNNPGAPNNLNVTVNTLMSYDNAMTTLAGPINNVAVVSTPMAFDIAAIQYLYGANTSFHTGNDTYVLTDTSWSCIWDCSGTDAIDYDGNFDAVINLNPATLDDTPTGGGHFRISNRRRRPALRGRRTGRLVVLPLPATLPTLFLTRPGSPASSSKTRSAVKAMTTLPAMLWQISWKAARATTSSEAGPAPTHMRTVLATGLIPSRIST